MQTLAASFVVIGIVILAALAFGLGEGTEAGLYLKTVCEPWLVAALASAGLLHLSLSLSRADHRGELDSRVLCRCSSHYLHLRH